MLRRLIVPLPSKRDVQIAWRYRGTVRSRAATLLSPQSRIGYFGWHADGNLGDVAMFGSAQSLLGSRCLTSYQGLEIERSLEKWRLGGRRYFSSIAVGGGTLIDPFSREYVEEALSLKLPMWTMGTGVGSCGWNEPAQVDLAGWREILRHFVRIGVRGPRSKQRLAEIGIESEIVGDLALALARSKPIAPIRPRTVAFNFSVGDAEEGQPLAGEGVRRLLARLLADGWRVLPIALFRSDVDALQAVLDVLKCKIVIQRPRSGEEAIDILAPCTMTIGVRLHSVILSFCAGVPALMLGYRDKCLDFMELMDLPQWHVNFHRADAAAVIEVGMDLADAADTMRNGIIDKAQHWKHRLTKYCEEVKQTLQ